MKSKIAVLYHFYYPDDVVSARHFQDLCEDLTSLGWDVEAWPSNRSCRNPQQRYPGKEIHHNVCIRRIYRPGFSQNSALGRIFNSFWMIFAWCWRWVFYSGQRPQVVLIGTDPVLALIAAIFIRAFDSKVKIFHWCFDLYPEAAVSDKKITEDGWLNRFLEKLMAKAYRSCDGIADLGKCMRQRLKKYPSPATFETLTPWAFYEPDQIQDSDSREKESLFGKASLGLLYSGNFGLAHSADLIGKMAEELFKDRVGINFSIRGHGEKDFRAKCAEKHWPIFFAGFASEEKLKLRLEAADIHLISLKENWTGMVVPSKFFGAIAAGRPVIFEGSEDSAVAGWIREYHLGWVLTPQTWEAVVSDLRSISKNPGELKKLQQHCLSVYRSFFCRRIITERWDRFLRGAQVR